MLVRASVGPENESLVEFLNVNKRQYTAIGIQIGHRGFSLFFCHFLFNWNIAFNRPQWT